MFRSLIVVVAMRVSMPLYALERSDYRQQHALFMKAVAADSGALDQIKALLLRLTAEEPENLLIMTYLGSTTTPEGRDAWMPWNKMRYTEQGLELLETIAEDPRYDLFGFAQRAHYLYYLGSAMVKDGRTEEARYDLQQVRKLNAKSEIGRKADSALEEL